MGIPLLEGRTFDRADHETRTGAAVVSESLARRFWPGQSPLGKRLGPGIPSGEPVWYTIVGVVGSVRDQGLHDEPVNAVYYPVVGLPPREGPPQPMSRGWSLVVRAEEGIEPESLSDPVRQAIWALDPSLPVAGVRTMEQVVAESTARTTFTMLLLGIAAAVSLLLGTVGLYGAISYVVSQRTREIGVRMALGAARGDVARLVLRQGLVVALAGVAVGLGGAIGLTRFLRALLFEVSPTDPMTFAAVPAILLAVAALAAWAPARRAASVDPIEALKEE
jgi:putative ABC transport system permease protein